MFTGIKERRVTVPLQGGLGNQLFQLAAGLILRHERGLPVVFSDYWLRHPSTGETPRTLAIDELLLPGELVHDRVPRHPGRWFGSRRVVERGPRDNVLDRVPSRPTIVAGYFQHIDVVQRAWPHLQDRMGASSNHAILNLLKPDPGAHGTIHWRLGDYLTNPQAAIHHGSATPKYVARAVALLSGSLELREWRIVSDDPPTALRLLAQTDLPNDVTVTPVMTSDAWLDLGQLANARGCVLSNSSFSWWGGYFAQSAHPTAVVFPEPWFDELGVPDPDLFPAAWLRLDKSSGRASHGALTSPPHVPQHRDELPG